MKPSFAQRVDNGFNKLTRAQRDRIDLNELDMEHMYKCAIGQAFVGIGYEAALYRLALKINVVRTLDNRRDVSSWAVENGFDLYPSEIEHFKTLTEEWHKRLLTERIADGLACC